MVKRVAFLCLGLLALMLGILGIVTPGLPVTPLLLLAVWSFARSSSWLHGKMLNNRYIGKYLREYSSKNGVSTKRKWFAFGLMWVMITVSCVFFLPSWPIRVAVLVLGVIGTVVMVRVMRKKSGPNISKSS